MSSKKQKGNWAKKDITLLTLLANESTQGSRELLKKYNKPDAINHQDLEQKLADLYFSTIDKVEIEKEMAKIHPHKEWILKYEGIKLDEVKKEEPKKEELKEIKVEQVTPEIKVIEEKKVEKDGDCDCLKKIISLQEVKSNADGDTTKNTFKENQTLLAVIGIVGIVAVIGLTLNRK